MYIASQGVLVRIEEGQGDIRIYIFYVFGSAKTSLYMTIDCFTTRRPIYRLKDS